VEIQYAYEMKAAQHGQLLHEKLIREKIGDTYYYCSNPRVQNVYGGLSRATIWPMRTSRPIVRVGEVGVL